VVLGVGQLRAGSWASSVTHAGRGKSTGGWRYQERLPQETEGISEIFPTAQVRSLSEHCRTLVFRKGGFELESAWAAERDVRRRVPLVQDDWKSADCVAWQRGPGWRV